MFGGLTSTVLGVYAPTRGFVYTKKMCPKDLGQRDQGATAATRWEECWVGVRPTVNTHKVEIHSSC